MTHAALTISLFLAQFGQFLSTLAVMHIQMSFLDPRRIVQLSIRWIFPVRPYGAHLHPHISSLQGLIVGAGPCTSPGANCEWSEIVFNQRVDTKKVNVGNKVYTPYGNDKPIQAGNRTPDVPNLVLVPVAAEATMTTTLFDLLTPSVHTTFMVIAENAPFPRSGRVVGGNQVLVDTEEGHTASMLTQVWKSFPLVVITRPDACIGAFVHDAEGVAKYFSKICLYVAVQLRTLLSSLDTIQEVLGLTHLSWLVASIEEFPGIPTRKLAEVVNANPPHRQLLATWGAFCRLATETVEHASRIRASCFSSSTRAREITRHTIPLLLDFTLRTLKILHSLTVNIIHIGSGDKRQSPTLITGAAV
ncbi:hypothetical protein BS47DRAFT_1490361 [Hydnum rufescens UP504]|uniref:Uncharacterized protein n=1 Tax=Hydnum rufescens UP504 TaxID=1448309 RepID=A0A9P6ADT8_9AGAM|nr:hypothetical protein BS47DRAFT_1490361 [Hydnum rufescens UP504]